MRYKKTYRDNEFKAYYNKSKRSNVLFEIKSILAFQKNQVFRKIGFTFAIVL